MKTATSLAAEIPQDVGLVPARVRRPLRAYVIAAFVSTATVLGVGTAVATQHVQALVGFLACVAAQGCLGALRRVRKRPAGKKRRAAPRHEAYVGSDPDAGLPHEVSGRRTFLEQLERRFDGAATTPVALLLFGAHERRSGGGKIQFEGVVGELAAELRWPRDILGSVGENRFAFGFADTTPEDALNWAKRIRSELLFHLRQGRPDVEISMGYACTDPAVNESFSAFYQRAHHAFQLASESEDEPILRAARPVAVDELEHNPALATCPPEFRDLVGLLTGPCQRVLDKVVVHRVGALVTYAQFYLANGQLAGATEADIFPLLDAYVRDWESGYAVEGAHPYPTSPERNQTLAHNVVHFVTQGTTPLERVVAARLLALQAFVPQSRVDGTLATASPQEIAIRLDLCASGIATSTHRQ